MNREELKELVKTHFNLVEVDNSSKQSFAEATLQDGTKVTNMEEGDFAEGQVLHVITEEGEHVNAPEGDHVTESGIVITVDAEGKITGVKYPDAEGEGSDMAEQTEEEMSAESVEEFEATTEDKEVEEKFEEEVEAEKVEASLEDIISMIGEVVEEKMAEHKEKMKQIEDKMMEIEEKMSAFAMEPAEEKTNAESNVTSQFSKATNRGEARYYQALEVLRNKNKIQ